MGTVRQGRGGADRAGASGAGAGPAIAWALAGMLAVVLGVVAGAAGLRGARTPPTPSAAPVSAAFEFPRHSDVLTAMKLSANLYRPTYAVATGIRNGWNWSTYFDGLQQLSRTEGDAKYRADAMAWGASSGWGLPPATSNERDPDSIKAGQTYYDLHLADPGVSLAAMDARMAANLAGQPDSAYDWIDALFMGLPNWTRWAERTGDPAYLDKMDRLYTWTRDDGLTAACVGRTPGLYDPAEHLWYRDCGYVGRRDANGQKVFWSRGNGWVFAALAKVLAALPPGDPRAAKYREMFVGMADRVRGLQGGDGFWRSSLLDAPLFPQPETSGTALFVSGLGWGVQAGLLDRPTYLPVLARAWQGLATIALRPGGFVSNCQPVGAGPAASFSGNAPTTPATSGSPGTLHTQSPPFCVGAVLLAGSALADLTGPMSTGRPVTATAQQAGNEAHRLVDGDLGTRWSAEGFPQSAVVDLGGLYRASNAFVLPYQDRSYRFRVDTSTDGVTWATALDRTTNTASGGRPEPFPGGPVSLRYARLVVTGVSGSTTGWVSIQEFSVHDRYRPRPDLALGRPVWATSGQAGHPAGSATDNAPATYWAAAAAPSPAAPQELSVELPAGTVVDTVEVTPRLHSGPAAVTLLGSPDGDTWTTLATATLPDTPGPHLLVFPAVALSGVALRSTSAHGSSGVQLEELAIHGG